MNRTRLDAGPGPGLLLIVGAILLAVGMTGSADAATVGIVGYDILNGDYPPEYFGWDWYYTGSINPTCGTEANFSGGTGTMADGVFGSSPYDTQLYCLHYTLCQMGCPLTSVPEITLFFDGVYNINTIDIYGGDFQNDAVGAGGEAIVVLVEGELWLFEPPEHFGPDFGHGRVNDRLDLSQTPLAELATSQVTLQIYNGHAGFYTVAEILFDGDPAVDVSPPIAHWKFDEGGFDDALDSSGNGNHGKLSAFLNKPGAKPLWIEGHTGGEGDYALLFDGSDGYVDAGSDESLDNLSTFTYTAWVKRAADGDLEIFSKLSSYRELRFKGAGVLRGCVVGNLAYACSDSVETVPLDTWTHVAMTYDHEGDKKVHLYINGAEVTYASQTTAAGQLKTDGGSDQNLGRRTNNSRYYWGVLDDMRIYGEVLPDRRIEQLAEGFGEPE